LIVFDYANDKPNQITEFLDQLVPESRNAEHKTRFLLITRNGQRGRVVSSLTVHQSEATFLLDGARKISLEPDSSSFDLSARLELFASARDSIALASRISCDEVANGPSLAADTFATPLFVVFAALLSVHADSLPTDATREEILERILVRERELFWTDCPERDPELRNAIVCAATIATSSNRQQIMNRLDALGYPADSVAAKRIANWLHALYPGPAWANGLEPDLLGEYLLSTNIPAQLAARIATTGTDEEISSLLRVLSRVAVDPSNSLVSVALLEVLENFPTMIEAWTSAERDGDAIAADALESATEFLEQIPEVLPLPAIKIPGRLGPAGNHFAIEAAWRWRTAAIDHCHPAPCPHAHCRIAFS